METVKLVDGTALRIIEYTVISENPDIGVKHLTTFADAQKYAKAENCMLTRIAQYENGTTSVQTLHKSTGLWYDDAGVVPQEASEDKTCGKNPMPLPIMHILKVHHSHLKDETKTLIRNWNVSMTTSAGLIPYGDCDRFIEGIAIATGKIVKEMPNDLIKVLRYAKQHNCGMVLVTGQTEIIPDLPVFNGEDVQKPAELNLTTLKKAYETANLDQTDFPAKLEIQYNFRPIDSATTKVRTEIFDANTPEQFENDWTTFCMEQHIHPDTIRSIEKLCDI